MSLVDFVTHLDDVKRTISIGDLVTGLGFRTWLNEGRDLSSEETIFSVLTTFLS